ncbi:MAG: hypothetical protein NC433_01615 [Clostridiales bacterium]|nr:hypothetical protein [Clostridiales bacterium]
MLNNSEKINAIAWRAKKEGFSYGNYAVGLSEEMKNSIYDEYEKYLNEKREREEARFSRKRRI